MARHLLCCALSALAGGRAVKVLHTKQIWFIGVFFGVILSVPVGEEMAVAMCKFCRAIWSRQLFNNRITAAGLLRRRLERSRARVKKGCTCSAQPRLCSGPVTPPGQWARES